METIILLLFYYVIGIEFGGGRDKSHYSMAERTVNTDLCLPGHFVGSTCIKLLLVFSAYRL